MSKLAIVTGASSGIGLATAKQLNGMSYQVLGLARNFAASKDRSFDSIELDLSKLDALPEALLKDDRLNVAPDVLVLNAGVGLFGGIEQFSFAQIRRLMDINVVSNMFLIKHFLPKMKAAGCGDIIIVGSESALQGARNGAVYCASKFALRGLAQSLRDDCSNSNIRVMLVNPGPVASDFFDDLTFQPMDGPEFAIEPDAVAAAIVHSLCQDRNVVSEEINLQPMKRSFKKK